MSLAAASFVRGFSGGRDMRDRAEDRRRARGVLNEAPQNSGGQLFDLLDEREGAGSYDTLFGHAQRAGGRDGGAFDGVRVSEMTLDELGQFSDPNGRYGQWVKGVLAEDGQEARVATPMGRGQIVGRTLRSAASEMGLPGNTVFSRDVQDRMIGHLAARRLASASTMPEKRAALRAEWEGFGSVPDDRLDAAILEFEGQQGRPRGVLMEG